MAADRQTIGLSPAAQHKLAEIELLDLFGDSQDVARFAFGLGVKRRVGLGVIENRETRWAIGNFDVTGEMRELIKCLHPECVTPVIQIEFYVHKGIEEMYDKLVLENVDIARLM